MSKKRMRMATSSLVVRSVLLFLWLTLLGCCCLLAAWLFLRCLRTESVSDDAPFCCCCGCGSCWWCDAMDCGSCSVLCGAEGRLKCPPFLSLAERSSA